MSTFTATGVPTSRRSIGLRIFLWLFFVLIVLIAGLIGYAYFIARSGFA